MTDDVTPECPRCHESREALARERERTSAAATEILAAMSGATKLALSDVAEARSILVAAPSETVQEAAARVARERDEARAEAARLRAIIGGRADPPSAAEVVVHGEAGGAWLVTLPARPPARMMPETRLASDPVEVWRLWRIGVSRWVPVLCGRPCAWPVVPTEDKVTP